MKKEVIKKGLVLIGPPNMLGLYWVKRTATEIQAEQKHIAELGMRIEKFPHHYDFKNCKFELVSVGEKFPAGYDALVFSKGALAGMEVKVKAGYIIGDQKEIQKVYKAYLDCWQLASSVEFRYFVEQ